MEGGRKLLVAVDVVRVEVGGDVVIGVEPPGWCFGGEVLDGYAGGGACPPPFRRG